MTNIFLFFFNLGERWQLGQLRPVLLGHDDYVRFRKLRAQTLKWPPLFPEMHCIAGIRKAQKTVTWLGDNAWAAVASRCSCWFGFILLLYAFPLLTKVTRGRMSYILPLVSFIHGFLFSVNTAGWCRFRKISREAQMEKERHRQGWGEKECIAFIFANRKCVVNATRIRFLNP